MRTGSRNGSRYGSRGGPSAAAAAALVLVVMCGQMHVASASFASAYEALDGCMLSMSNCRNSAGDMVSAAFSADACAAAGGSWAQTYADASALEAAAEATEAAYASRGVAGVFIAEVASGLKSSAVRAAVAASGDSLEVDEFLYCNRGANTMVFLDGSRAEVDALAQSGVVDFAFAMPAALKISPHMAQIERATPRSADRPVQRRVKLSPNSKGRAEAVMMAWRAKHEARRRLAAATPGSGSEVDSEVDSEATFHVGYDVPLYEQHRREMRGRGLEKREPRTLVISTLGAAASLDWVGMESECTWVEAVETYTLSNFDAMLVTQSGVLSTGSSGAAQDGQAPFWAAGVEGQGQVVGVGDTGLDTTHCMFDDANIDDGPETRRVSFTPQVLPGHRKVAQYVTQVDTDEGERAGHGTHVCGSIAGKQDSAAGAASGDANFMKGMAYEAKLAFFDIGFAGSRGLNPPNDLNDDFFPRAYEVGARLHSNSWGATSNSYSGNARQVDEFSFANQDFLILYANGNSGEDPIENGGSVGTPATAKSALSVGASLASTRAYNLIGNQCPSNVGGNCANSLADFSSNGPTSDGRIKPDVVAPGRFIGSSSSSTGCGTAFLAGTSMATPVTAGNAALVRQFIMEGRMSGAKDDAFAFTPMGALVKAVLINGADLMTGSYSNPNVGSLSGTKPGNEQGFGRVNLANTLLLGGNTDARSVALHGDFADMPLVSNTGAVVTYSFEVTANPSDKLRATLTWFDPPGPLFGNVVTINDLDLKVTAPNGEVFFPNGRNSADPINTVEQVEILAGDLVPGTYTVTVTGADIEEGPQPYAFVFRGPLVIGDNGNVGVVVDENGEEGEVGVPNNSEVGSDFPVVAVFGALIGVIGVVGLAAVAKKQRRTSNSGGGSPSRSPKQQRPKPQRATPHNNSSPSKAAAFVGFLASKAPKTKQPQQQQQQQQQYVGNYNDPSNASNAYGYGYQDSAPAPFAPPMQQGLPPNWVATIDSNSGNKYYYNTRTNETSWDVPTGLY